MAWEYNSPPYAVACATGASTPFLEASDNVVVEAMRRDGEFIEVRLAECLGRQGAAHVMLHLPHKSAALTNLVGDNPKALAGGPRYEFPVRPQQIVTLRFRTTGAVPIPPPLLAWDPLAPPQKRAALHQYSNEKGHPPRGV